MLKHRVIPILMWDGIQAVQSVQFKRPHRKVGSMMQHIRIMETRNIDELIILDVEATPQRRKPLFDEIKEYTKELFCPLTIGGGVTTLDDIGRLIQECGADKVAICDAALYSPRLIEKAADKYGSQAIVGVINAKIYNDEHLIVNGTDTDITDFYSFNYAYKLEQLGVGEILLTSVDRNGEFCRYDNSLIGSVSNAITVPLVANGGCGIPQHMIEAIEHGASACAASSMFLFTNCTPKDCSKAIQEAGYPARIDG